MTLVQSGYAPVNGLNMYYEVHGTGKPLVLHHGGLSMIDTDFGRVPPTFAKTRQVIAVEQQGHGHTADVDRPLKIERMAEDTAELLRQLDIESADFFGYSMGGGTALHIACSDCSEAASPAISSAFHLPGSPYFPGPRTSRSCTAPIGCFR